MTLSTSNTEETPQPYYKYDLHIRYIQPLKKIRTYTKKYVLSTIKA